MKRLIIAIDCDDVLVETSKLVAASYNQEYGTSLQLSDFYVEDPAPWGVDTIDEASERFHKIVIAKHAELVPNPQTVQAVKQLAASHELHLVTGRNHVMELHTVEWINQYFRDCFSSVELTNLYDSTRRRTKGEVCKQLSADVLIDDHLLHIHSVLQEAGLKEVIVFGNYPWNQEALPEGAVRCLDWGEIEEEINRIAGE